MNCQVLVHPSGVSYDYSRQCRNPATYYRSVVAAKEMVGFCGQHWHLGKRQTLPITDHGTRLYASPRGDA